MFWLKELQPFLKIVVCISFSSVAYKLFLLTVVIGSWCILTTVFAIVPICELCNVWSLSLTSVSVSFLYLLSVSPPSINICYDLCLCLPVNLVFAHVQYLCVSHLTVSGLVTLVWSLYLCVCYLSFYILLTHAVCVSVRCISVFIVGACICVCPLCLSSVSVS
jgi:hypothetical protein